MLMQCKLIREGGSEIELADGTTYHFKPNAVGDHVCEVNDEDHVEVFLSIPEGYRPYTKSVASKPVTEEVTESGEEVDSAERDELVKAYTEKFGKAPHHKLSIEKLKAALEAE